MIYLGDKPVGPGERCYVIAELGINANGDMDIARRMIDAAADAGADAVKTQCRTIEACYSEEELARPLDSAAPFGWKTRGDYVRGRELSIDQHWELSTYAAHRGLHYSASAWDLEALGRVELIDPPWHKVASAMLTNAPLLSAIRLTDRPVIVSTGMSSIEQVDRAMEMLGHDRGHIVAARLPVALLHCVSAYPCAEESLNLRCIETLRDRYSTPVGYSGHETGIAATLCAVVLGACIVERHLTLDRAMFGSDQAASLEPEGFRRLVRDIRMWEAARGDGVKRVHASEEPVLRKLRRM